MVASWKRLTVTITLESPLALAERRADGQVQATLDHVPGARVRGAAAERLLADGVCPPAHRVDQAHCGAADCPVGALFGRPTAAIFYDCLPASAPDVLPATARTCPHVPGFRTQGDAERGHGVFDTLVDRAFWEILQPAGLQYAPTCPECGARAAPYAVFYGRGASGGTRRYFAAHPPTRLLARAPVERASRVAARELAQALPVIAEASLSGRGPDQWRATTFRGEVAVADDADGARLADALGRLDHLGGGTSRGLGAVRTAVGQAAAPQPVAERLEDFARAVSVRRGQYARLAPRSAASLDGSFFSVDLRADALLRRGGWEPTTLLDADLLRTTAGVADASLTLVRAYAAPDWRGGWNAAWRLPRPAEMVARRGNCYLFRTADLAAWTGALEALEQRGIGARTADGYGEVRICDPFHLILREQAV